MQKINPVSLTLLTHLLFHVFHSPYSSDINSKVHKGEPPELGITFSAEYKSTSEKLCINVLLEFISMLTLCWHRVVQFVLVAAALFIRNVGDRPHRQRHCQI